MEGTIQNNSKHILKGRLCIHDKLIGKLENNVHHVIKGSLSTRVSISGDTFEGPYMVTPTRSTQLLHTSGKAMISDVIINPIPSNYGLVTWNGSVLTIS